MRLAAQAPCRWRPLSSNVGPQMTTFADLDTDEAGQLMVAMQRAILDDFTEGDWTEFAYRTGTQEYVLRHERLLRSLKWGDDDYGPCVFQALRYLSVNKPDALSSLLQHAKIQPQLERSMPAVLQRLGMLSGHVSPIPVARLSAPEVVARALLDADTLLKTAGPISTVDRLHTALHGYFASVCTSAGLAAPTGAAITALFKTIRTTHPAFSGSGQPHEAEIARVLNGFAGVIDALNTLRNHASVAHPNQQLLGEAEAHLMVNACRTLFHYMRVKVEP
jgi:hypothetical protein